ncbi:MarR family winged helix-turn-helix transcriptional regulator [Salinibacterium sp. ZJ77]|uniref:MarR family winged helix-turn-helix transcriptional regulator n=1 Tax=Salinibacterium sp. ZJ77 TaxID=2708337 RepID=UPI00141F2023|nr:MarR family winged helix-turn-helix transcriptional regulator [Salinibacterium sp. ZJ77]
MSSTTDHSPDEAGESLMNTSHTPSTESAPAPTATQWNVWREFFRAGRELNAALDRRLQDDVGISHPEFLVLIALWRAPDKQLRTGELAHDLNWEKSRVSHQVSRMVNRGFLERRECVDDARGVWVALTDSGSRVLNASGRDHGAAITEWFLDLMDDHELEVVERVSQRIREKLIEAGVAPTPRTGLAPTTTLLEDTALPRETEAGDTDAS